MRHLRSLRRKKAFTNAAIVGLAILLTSCAHTQSAPDVRLYAIDCGRMLINGIRAANPCFLIRHPKGDLIWDVGLPQSMADAPGGVSKLGRAEVTLARRLTDMLAELRLAPLDIEYLAISHSHVDHIGNGALFAGSTWIVDVDERTWAFAPLARAARSFSAYGALENAQTRLIEGDEDYDVFLDGTVTIIQAPGHTPGHCVLLLRLPQTGAVLLAGDIWNTAESGSARNRSTQELQSMEKVERIASATRARVIRQHVLEDFEALPRFPDFLR